MKTCEEYVLNELEKAKAEVEDLKDEMRILKEANKELTEENEKNDKARKLFKIEESQEYEEYYQIRFKNLFLMYIYKDKERNDNENNALLEFIRNYE